MRRFYSPYTILIFFLIVVLLIIGYLFAIKYFQKKYQGNLAALENDNWKIISKNAVNKYVGNSIVLPYVDSLYVSMSEYQRASKKKIKIVSFVDGDCSTCLLKISFWKNFISEIKLKNDTCISIIIYAYSSFEENMRNYMKTEWIDQYLWQFDKNKSYINDNELYDLRLQTVLLNSENEVILIGDPLLNPTLKKLYIKTILSLL